MGIDLGGTKILTAVVNTKGEMLSRDHSITPAEKGQDAVIQSIYQSMEHSLAQAGIGVNELAAIAVGAPGPSNPHTGILYSSPNLPHWKDVPLKNIFEQKYDKKTFLINDGNAAAFAEFRFGSGRDTRCFVYVTVSTGIGGGIVIDGKVFTGAIGTAGEIGHMTIDNDGPVCSCGNRGCWEALASGTAMAREARRKISEGRSTEILTMAEGEIENVTAEIIQKAAQAGDVLAKELVAETSRYLGTGF
ncbi:MAG: ROK family protein, partial [Desulfosarcinaceae bacterium]